MPFRLFLCSIPRKPREIAFCQTETMYTHNSSTNPYVWNVENYNSLLDFADPNSSQQSDYNTFQAKTVTLLPPTESQSPHDEDSEYSSEKKRLTINKKEHARRQRISVSYEELRSLLQVSHWSTTYTW